MLAEWVLGEGSQQVPDLQQTKLDPSRSSIFFLSTISLQVGSARLRHKAQLHVAAVDPMLALEPHLGSQLESAIETAHRVVVTSLSSSTLRIPKQVLHPLEAVSTAFLGQGTKDSPVGNEFSLIRFQESSGHCVVELVPGIERAAERYTPLEDIQRPLTGEPRRDGTQQFFRGRVVIVTEDFPCRPEPAHRLRVPDLDRSHELRLILDLHQIGTPTSHQADVALSIVQGSRR